MFSALKGIEQFESAPSDPAAQACQNNYQQSAIVIRLKFNGIG